MYLGRTTLSKFLIQQLTDIPDAGDLGALLVDVAAAVKAIAAMTAKGALGSYRIEPGTKHVQDETQHTLDVLAHEVMIRSCEWNGLLAGMVAAGLEDPYAVPAEYVRGRYLLAFNPLDGSANTDVNVSVGTIFSVLRHDPADAPCADHYLQCGQQQAAAGYAIYGPATMMVISVGKGTHGFTLDREIGNFILTHPDLQIPADAGEFAINTSNARFWEPPIHRYVTECQAGKSGVRARGLQYALDRLTDRGRAPHAHARRRLHASEGHRATAAAPRACDCSMKPIPSACWWSRRAGARAPAVDGCWGSSRRCCTSACPSSWVRATRLSASSATMRSGKAALTGPTPRRSSTSARCFDPRQANARCSSPIRR